MSGSATCKYCGRPIVWAKAAWTERNIALDPDPTERGDLVLKAVGTERGRVLFRVRRAEIGDTKRHRSHFKSCPKMRLAEGSE